jgi:protein SCO1/2
VFPEVDSVPVLKEYAVKYGVNDKKMEFATVTKKKFIPWLENHI